MTALLSLWLFAVGAPADAAGIWEGALAVGGSLSLRLVVHIARGSDGQLTSTMDSPDQGAKGIPVATTTFDGHTLQLDMPALKATYAGTLESDGAHLAGHFTQAGSTLPLALHRVSAPTEKVFPQTPRPPFPYDVSDVTIASSDGVQLAGTLTRPHGPGPFAAVVLLPGSGPHDRNETIFGHQPFWVLADALTRRGIAVLRFDARGVAKSTGSYGKSTTYDFVKDARATVEFLRARADIDKRRVGLLGHSEGTIVAALAAAQSPDVAFLVLLGAPGLTGEEIVLLQSQRIAQASGASAAQIASSTALQKKLFAVIKSEKDDAVAAPQLRALLSSGAGVDDAAGAQIKAMLSPWYRTFLTLDPRVALRQVHVPVLALIGEHDLQVPPAENIPELRKALAKNPAADIRQVPGVNHLFQTTKTGLPQEYATLDETFAPSVLTTIGDFLTRVTKH